MEAAFAKVSSGIRLVVGKAAGGLAHKLLERLIDLSRHKPWFRNLEDRLQTWRRSANPLLSNLAPSSLTHVDRYVHGLLIGLAEALASAFENLNPLEPI